MGAALAWFTTVVLIFAGVFALYYMGVNLSSIVTSAVTGIVHSLGQPLAW